TAGRNIIRAGGGGAVGGGVADTEGGRTAGAGDSEGGDLAAAVAFGDGDIPDDDSTDRVRIVVDDGAESLGVDDGGSGGSSGQIAEEGLIGLERAVAVDGDGDGLGVAIRRKVERAAGGDVIGACGGGHVGGGVVDAERARVA